MNKLFAICAVLALATPALANASGNMPKLNGNASAGPVQDQDPVQDMAGQPVMDPQNHQIGTVKFITKVNGRQAAVVSVDHMGDVNDVALRTKDFRPSPSGKGVTVAMSASELFNLPTYFPGVPYPLD